MKWCSEKKSDLRVMNRVRSFREWLTNRLRWHGEIRRCPTLRRCWRSVAKHPRFREVATRRWWVNEGEIKPVTDILADLEPAISESPQLQGIVGALRPCKQVCVVEVMNYDHRGPAAHLGPNAGWHGRFFVDADTAEVRHVIVGPWFGY